MNRRALMKATSGAIASTCLPAAARAALAPLRLRRGVNTWPWFSLTKEFPAPRTDYAFPPFQDQRPVPSPSDLARLRDAGLDFIRLPVDPGPFLAFSGKRRESLLADLEDAVARAIDVGLSVVVNLQANGATHYWRPERMIASLSAPAFGDFRDIVRDVATLLSAFDAGKVALEPVNEPPQACGSRDWTRVQDALGRVCRDRAPNLTYVATGACGSMIRGFEGFVPASWMRDGPTLYTFHFYEPYLFTHQGAPWMREPVYRALNAVPWPSAEGDLATTLSAVRRRMAQDRETMPAEKERAYRETERVMAEYFAARPDRGFVEHYLSMMKDWGEAAGVPTDAILLGEFGALRSDDRYVASGAPDRARYVRDVRESVEALGFPWAFWNLFDGMGIMDDATRRFDPAMLSALGLSETLR